MNEKNKFPASVEFLYGGCRSRQNFNRVVPHSHADFWQLEIAITGEILTKLGSGSFFLESGQGLLLPPNLIHDFRYDRCEQYASIKFNPGREFAALPMRKISCEDYPVYFLPEIVKILEIKTIAAERICSCLIGGLFALCYQAAPEESAAIAMVENLLAHHPSGHLSVGNLARLCGYSPDYLNRLIKKRYGVSAKLYLDRNLAERARHYLNYSSLNIFEIAQVLEFNNIFAFSRFFSRLNHGESPTAYRKRRQDRDSLFHP